MYTGIKPFCISVLKTENIFANRKRQLFSDNELLIFNNTEEFNDFLYFFIVDGRIRSRIRIRDVLKLREYTDPEHYSTIAVFFPFQIPDPRSETPSKNLSIVNPKIDTKFSSLILDLDFVPSRIPDPGVEKAPDPDPQHWYIRYLD
jgi:hypothetical protein